MTICIFGDSITWGAFDYDKGGWVQRLKSSLMKEDFEIFNLGISGDTTDGLLKRFEKEIEARFPEAIVFAIGINDSSIVNGKNTINQERFKDNLLLLYELAKKITDNIIFIGLSPVDENLVSPYPLSTTGKIYQNKAIEEYDSIIKSFCEEEGVEFIQINDLINLEDLEDGLHPNPNGHQKIFERIKEKIEKTWLQ